MEIHQRIAATCTVALLAFGLTAAAPTPPVSPALDTPRGAVTDHVVVVSVDGLRPDVLERYPVRVLQALMREGAYTLTAQTVFPSKTLPSHTSMVTGVPPGVHGVTWNSDETESHGVVPSATIFELARIRGFRTAAFFSKSKLRHLIKPGTLDHAQAPSGLETMMASQTVEAATRYIRFRRPNLTFVHLAEPDAAGHSFGWLSRPYEMAVRRADAAVGQIVQAADAAFGRGNYTLIVTADHGGHARGHGSDHGDDMNIPWIAWGAGVRTSVLEGPVSTMDTAATALWLLGIAAPEVFHGRPVAPAFTPSARLFAAAAANAS